MMTPNVGAVNSDVTGIYDATVFGYDIYKAWCVVAAATGPVTSG
jgi:hypothetical protein